MSSTREPALAAPRVLAPIAAEAERFGALRRRIHAWPETGFAEHRTAALVAEELCRLGIPHECGIGGTGVVATLRRGRSERCIALRADMDALPMQEQNAFAHRSQREGVFHGCGHDGHTAMLLAAAACLTAEPRFDGTVHLVFQPAEEGLGGARAMIEDGLFERFPCEAIFGMHNWPGLALGRFALRSGAFLASSDTFVFQVEGVGGHAGFPELARNPIPAAGRIVAALDALAAAMRARGEDTVVSVTQFHAGSADNVIPPQAEIRGTVRAASEAARERAEAALREIAASVPDEVTVRLDYRRLYPVLVNTPAESMQAARAAAAVVGEAQVERNAPFVRGSEDFAEMLRERPGCYILIGGGDAPGTPFCHHPCYDFNDEMLPIGASYWVTLVEQLLAASADV